MASTFESRELLRPGGLVANGDGASIFLERDVRVFQVAGNDPTESVGRLVQDFPNYREHPSGYLAFGGLTVGQRIGSDTSPAYEIEVAYIVPGGSLTGGGTPVDRSKPTFRAVATESVPIELEAPIFTAIPLYLEVQVAEGQPPTRSLRGVDFKQDSLRFTVMGVRLTVEINLPAGGWGPAEIAAVAAQYNKVHTFYGRQWMFIGASQSFGGYRADQHKVIYSWLSEPGVPAERFAEYNARQALFGNGGYPIPGLLPFERWIVFWAEDVDTNPFPPSIPFTPPSGFAYLRPDIYAEGYFESAPGGHAALPGGPIQ